METIYCIKVKKYSPAGDGEPYEEWFTGVEFNATHLEKALSKFLLWYSKLHPLASVDDYPHVEFYRVSELKGFDDRVVSFIVKVL